MATQSDFISKMIKQPFTVALLILSIVIIIVWLDQRNSSESATNTPTTNSNLGMVASPDPAASSGSGTTPPLVLNPPSVANSGRNQPRIMDQLGTNTSQSSAPGLEGLLDGLEAKVKADPSNIGNRILLAQTYKQLGFSDKAMTELRSLYADDSKNDRVNLVLGSILSNSEKEQELKESLTVLDSISANNQQQYLAQLYRGDAHMNLGQKEKAVSAWQEALNGMPKSDGRYVKLQQKIEAATSQQ